MPRKNGPISLSTTVRLPKVPVNRLLHAPAFQGVGKSATIHASSGVSGGNPWTVIYASRHRLREESCWVPGDR